jgi:hypothetical protein
VLFGGILLIDLICYFTPTQCPQCGKRYKQNNIINLYVPEIAVPSNDLEKVSYASVLFVEGICDLLLTLI